MASIAIGAAIIAFTCLKAGPALLRLAGRERNPVFDLAWPLTLWMLWWVLLYALVPRSELTADLPQTAVLAWAVTAVSLVHGVELARVGWAMRGR